MVARKARTAAIAITVLGTTLASVAVASNPKVPPPRHIYVTIRKDGISGSGTQSDPYDGGTARKFDAIMDSLPHGARVVLEKDAVFYTNGRKWNDKSAGWSPKSGLFLDGNGATIRLENLPNDWSN